MADRRRSGYDYDTALNKRRLGLFDNAVAEYRDVFDLTTSVLPRHMEICPANFKARRDGALDHFPHSSRRTKDCICRWKTNILLG